MSESDKAQSEIILAKQRNGPTGTVHMYFNARYTRFETLDKTHEA
jgi:replicative DNA helicase